MRSCNPTLGTYLAIGLTPLGRAECFRITTQSGSVFKWTSWDKNVVDGADTFTSQGPWLKRSKWSVTNTMQVPSMTVTVLALTTAFNGGADLRSQIAQGMLDGAEFTLTYYYYELSTGLIMGNILIFGGTVSTVSLAGTKADITVKGANNKLDQNAPRRVYQIGCNNTFCDAGCTLLRASYTASYTMGATPTKVFIPWASAPANPAYYQLGTVTVTSGPASGESMTVDFADATGLTLSYPLHNLPVVGNTFTAFEGCDKTQTTCSRRGNTQHGLWFPFVPPAETAF